MTDGTALPTSSSPLDEVVQLRDELEAAAFAWLARKAVLREKLALQSTTGAQGARVLGCVYPG